MNKSRRHIQRAMEIMKNKSFGTPTVLITDEKSMLDQITFIVEVPIGIEFTLQSVQNLSPMKFSYKRAVKKGDHLEQEVVNLYGFKDLSESDKRLSNEERNMKMARYFAIRQAWEYCQIQTHEMQFPKQLFFVAEWKQSEIPIIEISCKLIAGNVSKLAYSLEIVEDDGHFLKIEAQQSGRDIDLYCSLNACIWGDSARSELYHKLTAENAHHPDTEGSPMIDRPKGHVRHFKADGCSYEGINQFGSSCWFVAVALILSKIEPLYHMFSNPQRFNLDVKNCRDIKKWLDYDRSNLNSSQASCQSPNFPEGLRIIYKRLHKRGSFDFKGGGGSSHRLLEAVLVYSQILPKHCVVIYREWSSINSSKKMLKMLAPLIKRSPQNDRKLRIFYSETLTSGEVHIDTLKDIIDKVKNVGDSAPLLGGMIGLMRIGADESNQRDHAFHSLPFTMCEGEPVICTWGMCDDTYNWGKLRIDQTHVYSFQFVFGAIDHDSPAFRPPPKQTLSFTHLVLRDPRNTVNVHVKVDTFKGIMPETRKKHAQIFGTVDDVKYEFNAPELQSHDLIPEKGKNISIEILLQRWYRISGYPVAFATDSFFKRIGPTVKAYIGDISSDRLKDLMQNFVFFRNKDTLLVLEPKIKRGTPCTDAFIQNSKPKPKIKREDIQSIQNSEHSQFSEIGEKVDLKTSEWHEGEMMYAVTIGHQRFSAGNPSITLPFYTSKKSHYYISQNLEMLQDIEKIENMFNSTEWNDKDFKYIQDIRERCNEGLKQLIIWIQKEPIEEVIYEFQKEKEIRKLKDLQIAFNNLSYISNPYENITNQFCRSHEKYVSAFVDTLGLANTLNTPSIKVVAGYCTDAINVYQVMETVDSFGNILRDIIESHGETIRKRPLHDGAQSSMTIPIGHARKSAPKKNRS